MAVWPDQVRGAAVRQRTGSADCGTIPAVEIIDAGAGPSVATSPSTLQVRRTDYRKLTSRSAISAG
ncbi:hypothetical protein Amsp01_069070 [Amycolatopsis sp. NBRC 101858]|nr:hypothetical protein Amsp01_069070 [Amycolatopsis sp. NBRC 101858]